MSTRPLSIIVLVHGFWVTARSWEHWIDHYTARDHRVFAQPSRT
jgi:alpha-beta hydrolase superfamily lysophospholipase